jgi:hypothetical protein
LFHNNLEFSRLTFERETLCEPGSFSGKLFKDASANAADAKNHQSGTRGKIKAFQLEDKSLRFIAHPSSLIFHPSSFKRFPPLPLFQQA